MYKIFTETGANANRSGVMENRDHSKNGASLKSLTSRRNFFLLSLFLPILLFGQVTQSNDSSLSQNEQKKLEGIGVYKVGKTTISIFDDEKVKTIKSSTDFLNLYSAKGIYKEEVSDVPELSVYYHLDYKVNDEITVDLELRFYNDTLYYISTDNLIRLQSYGTIKLQKALELAGYLEKVEDKSETKTYQNRMGATFEKYEPAYRYIYYTYDNIIGEGYYNKYYRKVDEASYVYYILLFDTYIDNKIKNMLKEKREIEKQKKDKSLIEGL